jgi:hypothetical protein
MAGDEGEPDGRQERHQADDAERERIARDVVDQPADCDVLHLYGGRRDEATGAVEREIAVPEGDPAGKTG